MTGSPGPLQDLKRIVAERTRPILIWVGAGFSVPAGMPTWAKLRNDLVAALKVKVEETGEGRDKVNSKLRAAEVLADSPWLSFQLLKEGLGPLEYEAALRRIINPANVKKLPETYQWIARLSPRGVLNLNIDGLAARSLSADPLLVNFTGREVENYFHVLQAQRTFVADLHGHIDDSSSWVFTEADLRALTSKESYRQFISTCLSAYCCVFVGISPHDVAVGGHLERVAEFAPSSGPHFWITGLRTHELNAWAQNCRLLTIPYRAVGEDHSDLYRVLGEIIEYRSTDEPQAPIAPAGVRFLGASALDPPDELAKLSAEEIRSRLNAEATRILSQATPEAYEEFRRFSEEYEVPIYRAWHVSERSPNNRLLGFTLLQKAGGGAFGSVYKAIAESGEVVAVKVLHQAVRTQEEMLQSFRRGVRAMSLLTEARLSGVTEYRAASEVPAMVVMDWIDGPTLKELVQAGEFPDTVEARVSLAMQLVRIVKAAHGIPARVLHRDIRPTNIMLRDFWSTRELDVVVLDFDLSWHKDANELSIIHGNTTSGYLAPEQLDNTRRVPTRSALVDSFGVGMTLFFLFSGRDPMPGESLHKDWESTLAKVASQWNALPWRSLGARISRIIKHATVSTQSARWDLARILGELERLSVAIEGGAADGFADLYAEELMARTYPGEYQYLPKGSVVRESGAGVTVRLDPSLDGSSVTLALRWNDSGHHDHQRVKKWVAPALESASQMMTASGWDVVHRRSSPQQIEIEGCVQVTDLRANLDPLAVDLRRVCERISFA